MESYGVGIIGWGVVGQGAVDILVKQRRLLAERCGIDFELRAIADLDLERRRPLRPPDCRVTDDATKLLEDGSIRTVLHLVGGTVAARDICLACLRAGKHVVTSNKALIAEHGDELFRAARESRLCVAYEAAVAGGIPAIAALRDGLVANHIHGLHAILNGTANFILTRMEEQGASFDEALAQAQRLGYAEADPSLDVDGTDTGHKLAILARIAYGGSVDFRAIGVDGIRAVTQRDIASAQRLGCRIKLLAMAVPRERGFQLRVAPCLVPREHPLAGVSANYNAVLFDAHAAGPTLLVGQGAGAMPTASAVVSDLVDIAAGSYQETAKRYAFFHTDEPLPVCPESEERIGAYARLTVPDEGGVLARIGNALSERNISIASIHQSLDQASDQAVIEVVTHACRHGDFLDAIRAIENANLTLAPTSTLRTLAT